MRTSYDEPVRSIPAFLIVAALVTLTPGPATATIIRVAVRDGRRAALGAVMGNSVGVLLWASLSAIGVSSLILASQLAFTVLKIGGAVALVVLGLRSLFHRPDPAVPDRDSAEPGARRGLMAGWRTGLTTS